MGNNSGHAYLLLSDENGANMAGSATLFGVQLMLTPVGFVIPFMKPFTFFASLHTVQKMTNFPVSVSSLCLCDRKYVTQSVILCFSVAY